MSVRRSPAEARRGPFPRKSAETDRRSRPARRRAGLLGWLPIVANLEYSVCVFKLKEHERALKLAFIVNMLLYALFGAAIKNYVGVLSCAVIAVTTLISVVKAAKGTEKEEA